VLVGAALTGVDLARAIAAAGGFATSWFAVLLASVALVAAWTAVALVRTRAGRPRWPWERDED
jgi:prolipoprotein diacylglyceryltransferase